MHNLDTQVKQVDVFHIYIYTMFIKDYSDYTNQTCVAQICTLSQNSLGQECRRLREQNVTLVRQMHEGFTATALQDIKPLVRWTKGDNRD